MGLLLLIIVTVVGLLMYVFSANPKVAEIGKIIFAVGLFFLVATLGSGVALPALGK